MSKAIKIIPEEIHFIKMEVLEQKIDVKAFKNAKQHKLEVAHTMMHNIKDERVKLELAFSFKDNNKIELLFFKMDFHFNIENMNAFYELNEKKTPVFAVQMVATLLGISLSTTRGIIFERLSNNGLPNVIIPVVSPQKMLNPTKN